MEQLIIDWKFFIPIVISVLTAIGTVVWNAIQQRQIERLKGESLMSIHVHKLQFEKEFEIYNALWGKLVDLKKKVLILRTPKEAIEYGKYEDFIENKLEQFSNSYDAVFEMVHNNKPFYSEDIFKTIDALLRHCQKEFFRIQFKHEKNEKSERPEVDLLKSIDKTTRYINSICEAIRKRIGMLNVK
jgi:hypothetical protein